MRDGGDDDGRQGVVLPSIAAPFDDPALDTPNCPHCLMRMEAVDAPNGEPYWTCTECGRIAIA